MGGQDKPQPLWEVPIFNETFRAAEELLLFSVPYCIPSHMSMNAPTPCWSLSAVGWLK
jgi:hypothetical protein